MMNVMVIYTKSPTYTYLKNQLNKYCRFVNVISSIDSNESSHSNLELSGIDLVFLEIEQSIEYYLPIIKKFFVRKIETIIISEKINHLTNLVNRFSCGFLLNPFQMEDLVLATQRAYARFQEKVIKVKNEELIQQLIDKPSEDNMIGVPTMDGLDFYKICSIVRCQGLEKCTQLVIEGDSSIISSYNLGAFTKILEPLGFFSPHRSHLINLSKVIKYKKEGTVIMGDNFGVPISKRRKKAFLEKIQASHLFYQI